MTRYFVTAWCDRPFYAQCEVEAETPQEALAKARDAIDDEPAEECDEGYYWDRWRVDTAGAEGLLLHLDEDAALREAAPELLRACRMVVDRWERGDLAEAARACQRTIDQMAARPSFLVEEARAALDDATDGAATVAATNNTTGGDKI
jgi:hypothetical protein